MSSILDIQDVRKSYSKSGNTLTRDDVHNVIDGLSMQVDVGRVTGLIGGNGAGKTTLFNIISGLLRPDRGRVHFHSDTGRIDCTTSSPWKVSAAGIGRMFQGVRVFGSLSIEDHMMLQARNGSGEQAFDRLFRPGKQRKEKQELLERVAGEMEPIPEFQDLWKERHFSASGLSYARQRLLSLAGLLLGDYDLLLLDEPTSGLNTDSFDTLYRFINIARKKGKTILLIEHNIRFIENAIDHCHFMSGGRIEFSGSPAEVLGHREVRESYLL
jgi:ABC-type branched-subunit amino acid transport system ATPase component